MELSQLQLQHEHGFLEELLAPRGDSWSTFSTEFFPNGWSFDSFDENPTFGTSNLSFLGFSTPTTSENPCFDIQCPFTDPQSFTFADAFTVPDNNNENSRFPAVQDQDFPSMVDDEAFGLLSADKSVNNNNNSNNQVLNMGGLFGDKKIKSKRLEGQPSKNLMAERRRRKRLNDRLSMLRSIVPKISKMDRTSILGDTIDYMKELLERINKLQDLEETDVIENQMNLMNNLNDIKPNEVLVRNSPKFDVDRREMDTRIDICCATKPGLLLSTVNTLEALGLEIQQCVISCFSDFSMQASCSEVSEQKTLISSEDIQQALFRNAGYGGRCL